MPDTDTYPDSSGSDPPNALGRLLFGGVLAMLGVDNLRNLEERTGYAAAKDVPRPELSVPLGSGALALGGIGLVLWRLPALAATAVGSFLLATNAKMHDFWNEESEEATQQEQIQFLKNTALLGGALVLLWHALGE